MTGRENHGGDLAPVIPLFGRTPQPAANPEPATADQEPTETPREETTPTVTPIVATGNLWVTEENPERETDADGWFVDDTASGAWPEVHDTEAPPTTDGWIQEPQEPHEPSPVRPLASAHSVRERDDEEGSRRRHPSVAPVLMRASDLAKPASEREAAEVPGLSAQEAAPPQPKKQARLRIVETPEEAPEATPAEQREAAELALVKKLRGRGMSISEARAYLRGLGYDDAVQNDTVELCIQRGYLDDAVLAEQIVYAGSTRKGQGRRAIALALSSRGIDRTVIDEAMSGLEDDDAERALEYARTKANSLSRLEPDVALRRLMGQLARRGFGGSVARDAAQTALGEVKRGPRFR